MDVDNATEGGVLVPIAEMPEEEPVDVSASRDDRRAGLAVVGSGAGRAGAPLPGRAVGHAADRALPLGGASRGRHGRDLPPLVPRQPDDDRLGRGHRSRGPPDRLGPALGGQSDLPAGGGIVPDPGDARATHGPARRLGLDPGLEPRRTIGPERDDVPPGRTSGHAAPGLYLGGRGLPPRGGRHQDRHVGDDPGQCGERGLELVVGQRDSDPSRSWGSPGSPWARRQARRSAAWPCS